MSKKAARKLALVLALTLIAAPVSRMYAQSDGSTPPTVVSGGDPEPTGEPSSIAVMTPLQLLGLAAQIAFGMP